MIMMEQETEKNYFQLFLEDSRQQENKEHALEKFRRKAWENFCDMGLPTKKHELFRYIKLQRLYEQEFNLPARTAEIDITPHILPESQQTTLTFVNGFFEPSLSRLEAMPEKIVILPLAAAMQSYGALLNNHLAKTCSDETDPFALLNVAFQSGLFMYIPPRTVCKAPIQLLHIVDSAGQKTFTTPRLQLFLGALSDVQLVSTHVINDNQAHCISQVTEAFIEDGARLHFMQVNDYANPAIWHFDAFRATLKRDSFLETVAITAGSATVRSDYRAVLAGSGSSALLNGVWMLSGKREAHSHVLIDHQAENCVSRQLFKGVLEDFSHSSFEGKILVRQEAQKTNAFQLNNNLLLSDYAAAESKPNLEIFADDVKASHGATVGQLDKEELFYMQSRGFSKAAAKNLLVFGFCQEVIDKISLPLLRQKVSHLARSYSKE